VEGGWEGANRKLNETSEAGALVVGPVSLEEMARMAEKEFPNNRFIDLWVVFDVDIACGAVLGVLVQPVFFVVE
jgi:hypothetical protein